MTDKEVAYQYIEKYPLLTSKELAKKIENEENIIFSEFQIRAFKFWHRTRNK